MAVRVKVRIEYSDALIQSLRIVLLEVKDGKWCFKGENTERESEHSQRWQIR